MKNLPGLGIVNNDDQNGRWIFLIMRIVRTELRKKILVSILIISRMTYTRSWGYFANSSEQRIGESPRSVATQAEPQIFNWFKQ